MVISSDVAATKIKSQKIEGGKSKTRGPSAWCARAPYRITYYTAAMQGLGDSSEGGRVEYKRWERMPLLSG